MVGLGAWSSNLSGSQQALLGLGASTAAGAASSAIAGGDPLEGAALGLTAAGLYLGLNRLVYSTIGKRGAEPPNRGFLGPPTKTTLQPGDLLDRYGNSRGVFASPAGTPFGQRSLPRGAEMRALETYRIIKPIPDVDAGDVAPWYGQRGLGVQYDFGNRTLQELIDSGHLEQVR